ncbi:MAG: DUF6029 family protein [Bacteroidota bacterium]
MQYHFKRSLLSLIGIFIFSSMFSQGYFSGDLQLNANFYVRDTLIGAANTPHYDHLKSGADAWIGLNYVNDDWKFSTGIRIDLFQNSNLHNPGTAYSAYGLGNFYIKKEIRDLEITGGYFYDQIGSGILFRAYEDRSLGIDNSLLGARLKYNVKDKLVIKAFSGVQKNRFELYKPLIKGLSAEGNFTVKDRAIFTPGIGVLNRTLDKESINIISDAILSQSATDTSKFFSPKYNVYAFSVYNTLNIGNFSWYIEGAYKTKEAIKVGDYIENKPGTCIYTTLTYAKKGFGVTAQFKRTENFFLKTSLNETLLKGLVSVIPPTARQNSLRLPARYNAATQVKEESAFSLDISSTPKKGHGITLSLSAIYNNKFKRNYFYEGFLEYEYKKGKRFNGSFGLQFIRFNQELYLNESLDINGKSVPFINAYTVFAEGSLKLSKKSSLRAEVQYQHCRNDFGQWIYGLLEYSLAPNFTISISDMWNFKANPENRELIKQAPRHYYSFFTSYTFKQHRLTAAYVRQVSGIVCTGGVCRFEPAFSGLRVTLNTSF